MTAQDTMTEVPAKLTLDLAIACAGTVVRLRPLRRGERELVVDVFDGLSADSRYHRFLQPMPRLPKAYLDRLVDVDGRRHLAVVALVDGECVGIARCIALPDEPDAAEVAVTVIDRYQGRGIGRLLVETLWPAAVQAGLATFVCHIHPTNRRALQLLNRLGVKPTYQRDLGLVEGRVRLPDQPLLGEPWTEPTSAGIVVGHHDASQAASNGSPTRNPAETPTMAAQA